MLLELVSPGGLEIWTEGGQDRRLVACGERFEVGDATGARLVKSGAAVELGPDGVSPRVRVRYIGPNVDGRIDFGKLQLRVKRNDVVSVPLWAANLLVTDQPASWRKEL